MIMGHPFPGPLTYKYHPWSKEMADSDADMNVGMKAAQMGFTLNALIRCLFKIDIERKDCLYVLPSQNPQATDFSSARFDAALELSPYLSNLFSDVSNVGHKRAGSCNLYIRGSQSRAALKSVPISFLVLDELDEMNQDNIPLAMERTSGQISKQVWALSTPTTPGTGIHQMFLNSSQDHFMFKCPSCSRFTELLFPDSILLDIPEPEFICKECDAILPWEHKHEWLASGIWEPAYSNRDSRGWYIHQMYSSASAGSPIAIAKRYEAAQQDKTEEQEFYNSTLGLPHLVEGAGIKDEDIDACIGNYDSLNAGRPGQLVTMGIDVGRFLHYEIDEWSIPNGYASPDLNTQCRPRVIAYGKVRDFEELDILFLNYRVRYAIIDMNPEPRKAFEFANRFYGQVLCCIYAQGVQGKHLHVGQARELSVSVNRTSWLDLALGRFHNRTIALPSNLDREYRNQLKALVRHYEKDKNGNPVGRYQHKQSEDDHYAHARNYAELALPFALAVGGNQDITL